MAFHGISWDYHNQVRNIWWHVNCQCDTWQQNDSLYNHCNHWVGLGTIESWHFLWWANISTFKARSTGLILIPLDICQLFYCGLIEYLRTISRPNAISHTDLRHFDSSLMVTGTITIGAPSSDGKLHWISTSEFPQRLSFTDTSKKCSPTTLDYLRWEGLQLNDTIPFFQKFSPCPTRLTKRGAPIHRGGFFYGPIQRGIRLRPQEDRLEEKGGILEDSAERMLGGFEIKTDP